MWVAARPQSRQLLQCEPPSVHQQPQPSTSLVLRSKCLPGNGTCVECKVGAVVGWHPAKCIFGNATARLPTMVGRAHCMLH